VEPLPADDAAVLERARRGEESAFEELYHRHRLPIFRYAWRLTGSIPVAEDVMQECFLALFRGAEYDPRRAPLRTYLLGMARRLAMRHVRLEEREGGEEADAEAPHDAMRDLLRDERSAVVERAVAALPPLQREAIVLFEYEELSIADIARITGAEPGAIKVRLHRARQTLRRTLAPLLSPDGGAQ
jgi:RNA polymerase sigma-70 factor (ECF subfamily)